MGYPVPKGFFPLLGIPLFMERYALVGREKELSNLLDLVEEVKSSGTGCTAFISGEAGIGKTRLSLELEEKAGLLGFKVLRGLCLAQSIAPLLPIREALRSGGLDHLCSQDKPPKVMALYLMNEAGMLIADVGRGADGLDSDIFAGMMTAMKSFVKDSLSMLDELIS